SFPLEGIRRPDDGKRKLTPLSRKWATGFRVVPRRASPRVEGASTTTNPIVAWAQCPAFSGPQDPDDSSAGVTLRQDWIEVQSNVHDQEIQSKFEAARRKCVCNCGEGRQKHQKMPLLPGASLSSESLNRFAPGHTAVTRHGSANPGIHDIAMNHI